MQNLRLPHKGEAFLITYPETLEINADLLDQLFTLHNKELIELSTYHWFCYQPDGDDYTYTLKMPGVKLFFHEDISLQKAKEISEQIIATLKSYYVGQKIELVVIDKTKLAE